MFQIKFPIQKDQRYYDIHYKYVLEIFKYLKCNIELKEGMDVDKTCFLCEINGQTFAFDFADSNEVNPIHTKYKTFKFHLLHGDATDNLLPFPPVSFYNWPEFFDLQKTIEYNPTKMIVSNRQRPYGNATVRRLHIQGRLKQCIPLESLHDLRIDEIEQKAFWKDVNNISLFVHVGGHHSLICDRSTLQLMGFGCGILSATIPEMLPWYRVFNGTYIRMRDDYSDLEEIILNSPKYYDRYKRIGDDAKELFMTTCTPEAISLWIQDCLKN
jgi:hypothetical protein